MKYLVILLLSLPFVAFGQQQMEYEQQMSVFQKYYNNNHTDSICTLFHPDWNKRFGEGDCVWKSYADAGYGRNHYGKLDSIEFNSFFARNDGEKVVVFDVVFEHKGSRVIGFAMKQGKMASYWIADQIVMAPENE